MAEKGLVDWELVHTIGIQVIMHDMRIILRLAGELLARIDEAARARSQTRSEWIRAAILSALEAQAFPSRDDGTKHQG